MRSEEEANRAIDRYADLVRRLCMMHPKKPADTEDIFQTVFLKYILSSAVFESPEHEKAWFIRVTLNACRDLLKRFFRSRTVSLDELADQPDQLSQEHREVLEAVLSLPAKYRDVVYLHYYEGYTAKEIGAILHKNTNTVYTLLTRAREQLRSTLGGERIEPDVYKRQIVAAAQKFIEQNKNRRPKHMKAVRGEGPALKEIWVQDRSAQYRYLAQVAQDCKEETAILYRDNDSALPLIDLLERQGIPYRCRQVDSGFFTHRVVRDIVDILTLAQDPWDGEDVYKRQGGRRRRR